MTRASSQRQLPMQCYQTVHFRPCYVIDVCNFIINEFDPTFEVENMGHEAFQNASFGNASFPNRNEGNSCLWAMSN